jgi:hypothetical protein
MQNIVRITRFTEREPNTEIIKGLNIWNLGLYSIALEEFFKIAQNLEIRSILFGLMVITVQFIL